ncbi:caspase family protein [Neotabrizicola shimadae]|uniref:Caspase family protein n=1 Tax=Neotabrizicola shimadae TaxID=2807096 RepID=A0A8G1EBH9_9RHOB|nr:caspase family protein [Neotabrizicola shimadae]QYZ68156.1 caspase family protein [Neotabrizicola shimadae]
MGHRASWRIGLGAALAGLTAGAAQAATLAVLVAAGDYRDLDADLKGPPNDVRLMAGVLAARGVAGADMLALTDAPEGLPEGAAVGVPDLAGIRAALADVAARAVAGDTVVFYFSGHGTQAPDGNGDEGGGADEVLLPVDALGWDGTGLRNVLVDDELGAWAQTLLARGVKVVGLIDACHSDTGFRAMTGAVARGLPPTALGVPEDAAGMGEPVNGEGLSGEFAFLYSSQADQRSFEFPLGEGQEWHGAFTAALAGVLGEPGNPSWGQVLAAASDRMARGEAAQLPDGEGPLLSAPVFGSGRVEARWRVEGAKLEAGLLQGLGEGDRVAFFAEAAGGEPLGEALVVKPAAGSARLDPAPPQGTAWAELVAAAPPPPLRLAAPVQADGLDYAAWLAALPAPAAGKADLVPVLVAGGLALAGPDGALDPAGPGSTPRVVPEEGEAETLALQRALDAAGHALRLKAALIGAAGRSLTGGPALEVAVEVKPGSRDGAGCGAPGQGVAADPAKGVAPCDQMWLTVTNRSGQPQDLTALYFAADFSVTPVWPRSGLSNRLAPGEAARIGLLIDPASPPALEDLLLVAVPASEDGPRTDLSVLASPQMTRSTAGADDGLSLWIDVQLTEDDAVARGFAARPPAFTLIRQPVRIRAGTE